MFKYHKRSDSPSSRHAIKWEEINPKSYETQVDSFETALEWLKNEEWWVYDCDGGNSFTYFVGLTVGEETRYYEIEHEFYAYYGDDEEVGNYFQVMNFFEVIEITKEKSKIPDNRDWLNISEYNYKLAKKWPPENDPS